MEKISSYCQHFLVIWRSGSNIFLQVFSLNERNPMETILGFFSDLILFTAGLAVLILWLVIFMAVAIEIHDLIFGDPGAEKEDENAQGTL